MEIKRKLFEKIADNMDLPGEPMPGSSILEILGRNRLLVEDHGGILHYSPEKIIVRLSYGAAEIRGTNLEISKMSLHRLIIAGELTDLSLRQEVGHGSV